MKKWMELRRTEMIMKQKLHIISIFESLFHDFCRLFMKMVNDSGDFIIQVCAYRSSKFGNIYNKFSTKKNHVCCVKITAWICTSCLWQTEAQHTKTNLYLDIQTDRILNDDDPDFK